MTDSSLLRRLNTLQQSCKQTFLSIQKLQKLPITPGAYSTNGADSDPRIELTAEIHQTLKEQENDFEVLRQEVEDETNGPRWVGGGSVRKRSENVATEREKIMAQVTKLGEDLKSARSSFRRAQLQAKRNSEVAKRKEREMLLSGARGSSDPPRPSGQKKLTQDELATNASNDVTEALRRTHQMMQDSIAQSQFAQQTFDQSSQALSGLDEQYSTLDTMLNSTKSLVSSLVRSQKSDTWYLETAFYVLVATISWLVFRRIFYGPLWWLVWQPMRWFGWIVFSVLSSVGMIGNAKTTTAVAQVSTSTGLRVPPKATGRPPERQETPGGRDGPYMVVGGGGKGGGWGYQRPDPAPSNSGDEGEKSKIDEVGEMIDNAEKQFEGRQDSGSEEHKDGIDNISDEERQRQEEIPRNPKKRMWEHEKEEKPIQRDEL